MWGCMGGNEAAWAYCATTSCGAGAAEGSGLPLMRQPSAAELRRARWQLVHVQFDPQRWGQLSLDSAERAASHQYLQRLGEAAATDGARHLQPCAQPAARLRPGCLSLLWHSSIPGAVREAPHCGSRPVAEIRACMHWGRVSRERVLGSSWALTQGSIAWVEQLAGPGSQFVDVDGANLQHRKLPGSSNSRGGNCCISRGGSCVRAAGSGTPAPHSRNAAATAAASATAWQQGSDSSSNRGGSGGGTPLGTGPHFVG